MASPRSVVVFCRRIPMMVIFAAVLVAAGILSVIVALSSQQHPPHPIRQAATAPLGPTTTSSTPSMPSTPSTPSSSPRRSPVGPGRHSESPNSNTSPPTGPQVSLPPGDGQLRLSTSEPVHLSIPAIGVSSGMLRLGLNPDHTVEVPPLSQVSTPGWYKYSPTPGEAGSSVMLGHVDSAAGPGVFFRLGALQPGDEVDVVRADGITAVFRVDRVAEYPKTGFPARLIYVPTNYPSLKLVTCGGRFDSTTGNYLDNIVAFATLVSSHR
jgi:Sortase domain